MCTILRVVQVGGNGVWNILVNAVTFELKVHLFTCVFLVVSDERMAELLPQVTHWLEAGCQAHSSRDYSRNTPAYQISAEDVDKISVMFPLCMRRLHGTLRRKHRLSHSFRVRVN